MKSITLEEVQALIAASEAKHEKKLHEAIHDFGVQHGKDIQKLQDKHEKRIYEVNKEWEQKYHALDAKYDELKVENQQLKKDINKIEGKLVEVGADRNQLRNEFQNKLEVVQKQYGELQYLNNENTHLHQFKEGVKNVIRDASPTTKSRPTFQSLVKVAKDHGIPIQDF